MVAPPHLVIGSCGAANILNLPSYLTWIRRTCEVRITLVLTESAAAMLPACGLAGFVDTVIDCTDRSAWFRHSHIEIAESADLFVVLPATAQILAAAATGAASSLLAALILASVRVTFYPSMNDRMYRQPAVQRNVAQLRADGHEVFEPQPRISYEVMTGELAENGAIISPPDFAKVIARFVEQRVARSWVARSTEGEIVEGG